MKGATAGRKAGKRAAGIALVPERRKDLDSRKLLINGAKLRRAEAWPDIEEGLRGMLVAVESTERQRQENAVTVEFSGAIKSTFEDSVELPGEMLAQCAACFVRAATNAVQDGVVGRLSPDSTELLARLEAAVAMGDESDA